MRINSDNATDDAEDSYLEFERGSALPNALLTWDSTAKEFDFNSTLHLTNTISGGAGLIVDAGNVGIGTSTPAAMLDVTGGHFLLGTNNKYLQARDLSGTVRNVLGMDSTNVTRLIAGTGGLNILGSDQSTSRLAITAAGNVGIGTTNPSLNLDVVSADSATNGIGFTRTGRGNFSINISGTGYPVNFNTSVGDLAFNPGNAGERVRFTTAGNIGIGTTTPAAALHIFTSATTNKSLRVETPRTASVDIVGDKDNESGEPGGAGVNMSIDGGLTAGVLGVYQNGGLDPNRNSYTDTIAGGGILLGSTTNHPLQLGTNGAVRLTVNTSGNVGIGTTNPAQQVSVNGSSPLILITNGSQNVAALGDFGNDTDGQLALYNSSGTLNTLLNGDTDNSYINALGGNVGIGITNPGAKLTVSGGRTYLTSSDATIIRAQNSSLTADARTWDMRIEDVSGSPGAFTLRSITDSGTTQTHALTLTRTGNLLVPSGNVGVGTTTPAAKLDIYANSGNFTTTLADFTSGAVSANRFYRNTSSADRPILTVLNASGEVFRVDGNGNVGIGTTTPGANLEIKASSPALRLQANNAGTASLQLYGGSSYSSLYGMSLNYDEANARIDLRGRVNGADSNLVTFLRSGNVGIGTTTPGANLNITTASANDLLRLERTGTRTWGINLTNGYFNITDRGANGSGTGSTNTYLSIDTSGNVGIGTTTPWKKLSVDFASGGGDNGFVVRDTTYNNVFVLGSNVSGISLSTYNSSKLRLGTNNTDRVTIDASGNVGIGTTTPQKALSLVGGAAFTSTSFATNGVGTPGTFEINGNSLSSPVATRLAFGTDGSGYGLTIAKNQGGTYSDLVTIKDSGNVGIGITNPSAKFEVSTDVYPLASIYRPNNSTAGFSATLVFAKNNASNARAVVGSIEASLSDNTASSHNGYLSFYTANTGTNAERVRIDTNGNLGIGTTNPGQKLSVVGDATASGYLRVGSNTAPVNTNAGDLTATRLSIGNGALSSSNGTIATIAGTMTDTAAGAVIGANITNNVQPASDSASSFRSLNMSNTFNTSSSFTGSGGSGPTAGWFENRVVNMGSATWLNGITTNGLIAGSNAASIGTVNTVNGVYAIPVSSFNNSLTGTITNAFAFHAVNSGANTLTITNQVGVGIDALSAATNNTALLIGQTTVPTGNYGIYNASANTNYFAGNVGVGTTSPATALQVNAAQSSSISGMNGISVTASGSGASLNLGTLNNGVGGRGFIQSAGSGAGQDLLLQPYGGNIGVGTSTPMYRLQINHSSVSYSNASAGAFAITNASNPLQKLYAGYDSSLGTNGSGYIQAAQQNAAWTPLLLNPNGGNVGIGTTNPGAKLDVNGTASSTNTLVGNGSASAPGYSFSSDMTKGFYSPTTANAVSLALQGTEFFRFEPNRIRSLGDNSAITLGSASDVDIFRDAANVLALRNGTNAQTFRVYNTFTDASNYERMNLTWSGNTAFLQTSSAGTGAARSIIVQAGGQTVSLRTNGGSTEGWQVDTGNLKALSDNTYDIGAAAANRPRNLYVGTSGFFGGNVGIGTTTNLSGALTANGSFSVQAEGDIFRQYDSGDATWYPIIARYNTANGSYPASTYIFGNGTNSRVGFEVPGGGNIATFQVKADSATFNGGVTLSGIASGAGTAYLCTTLATGVISTSTSACAPSSLRYKENVSDIAYGLDSVLAMRAVSYDYKPELKVSGHQVGFIAEEMYTVVPEVVGLDSEGEPNNIDYAKLTSVLARAIQEIAAITGTFRDHLVAWLGDATNGIGKLFAQEVHTEKLCVKKSDGSEICLDGDQVASIAASAGAGYTIVSGPTTMGELEIISEGSTTASSSPETASSTPELITEEVASSTPEILTESVASTTPPTEVESASSTAEGLTMGQ
jgi:hypothetical protein